MLQLTAKKTKKFFVPQDSSGETWVEITHLKPGEVADIEAKANQITGKQYSDTEDFVTEIDFKLNERTKNYVVASITDWGGFAGLKGKPLKCTDVNKRAVLKEFEWFGTFIMECREELEEEVEEELETAEKN